MSTDNAIQDPLQHLADLPFRDSSSEPEGSSPGEGDSEESTETPSTDTVEPTLEEIKAELEASKAREKKLEQQVKSSEGRTKRETSDRALQQETNDRIAALEKSLGIFISTAPSGDMEKLSTELGEARLEDAKGRAEKAELAQVQRIKDSLEATIKDEEGNLLITKEQAQELVAKWKATETSADLVSVVTDAAQMVLVTERQRAADLEKKVREEEKAAAKQREEDAGIGELDTGPGAGGSSNTAGLSPREKIQQGMKEGQGKALFG